MKALLGILVWLGFIGVLFGTLWIYQERDRQHQFALGAGPTREPHSPPVLASGTSHSDSRAFESGAGSGAQSSPPHERTPDGHGFSNANEGVDLVRGVSEYAGHGDFEVSEARFVALAAPIYRALELDWDGIPEGWAWDGRVYSIRELRHAMCGDEASIPEPERMLKLVYERKEEVRTLFAEHQALLARQAELVALIDMLDDLRSREPEEIELRAVRTRLDEIRCAIWDACGDPAYRWLYELDKATR